MSSNKHKFSKDYIRNILNIYCDKNNQENIMPHLNKTLNSNESAICRKNFLGHITSSAIVLDSTLSKILLIHHKKLNKLIQPGGHIDETDKSFSDAAIRELMEETGFANISPLLADNDNPDLPIDIDIHTIPENEKKQELEHLHFDFRYTYILLDDCSQGKINLEETDGMVWVLLTDLKEFAPDLSQTMRKIKKLTAKNQKNL